MDAIYWVRHGKTMARRAWDDPTGETRKSVRLTQDNASIEQLDEAKIAETEETVANKTVGTFAPPILSTWTPDMADLLADDWYSLD